MAILRWGNDSGVTFQGYLRATVDSPLPFPNGFTDDGSFFLGNQSGLDTWTIDLYCGASSNGDRRQLNTEAATPLTWTLGNPTFGTVVAIQGIPMTLVSMTANGAAWDGHWRARVGPMLLVQLFVHWYPDDQQYAYVEVIVASSNPEVQDVRGTVPSSFTLDFDGATVILAGLADNAPLLPQGDWIADGQTRIVSGVLCWPSRGGSIAMCRALAEQRIALVGIDKIHAGGNPYLHPSFDPVAWTSAYLPQTIQHANDWPIWDGSQYVGGITPDLDQVIVSGASGGQGSQNMGAGPGTADPGCTGPIYLAALAMKWPCCHCEIDGRLLDAPPAHPNLRMNYGRVNRALELPDTLGKLFEPSTEDRRGFAGPEWEHDFDWILWAGKRLRGTAALEWLVSSRARLTLHSSPRANPPGNYLPPHRGIGWYMFKCVEIWRNLTDRAIALQVAQQCVIVIDQVLSAFPAGQPFPQSWWRWDSSGSLGGSPEDLRSDVWQVAVMCLGLRWAGEAFAHPGAITMADEIATEHVNRVWFFSVPLGNRWTSRNIIRQNGQEYINPATGQPFSGAYDFFAQPYSVAARLLQDPTHVNANAIWTQLRAEMTTWKDAAWLGNPGVLPTSLPAISGTASTSVGTSVSSTNVLSIAGSLSPPQGDVGTSMVSTASLPVSAVASGSVGTAIFAVGSVAPRSSGVVSVSVVTLLVQGDPLPFTGTLLIAGTASGSVNTAISLMTGANLLGLSGAASIVVTASATGAGVLPIACSGTSITLGTSVTSTGVQALAPGPISGSASVNTSTGAAGTATNRNTNPGPRRRIRWWRWWQVATMTSRDRTNRY